MREDLKKPIRYEIAWIRNKKGKVIIDRKFNTARLMSVYLGRGGLDEQGITWDPDDPNRLAIRLPGSTRGRCRGALARRLGDLHCA